MSGGSDRLFSDKFTRSDVEDTSEEAKKMEISMALKTDLIPEEKAPPTRL